MWNRGKPLFHLNVVTQPGNKLDPRNKPSSRGDERCLRLTLKDYFSMGQQICAEAAVDLLWRDCQPSVLCWCRRQRFLHRFKEIDRRWPLEERPLLRLLPAAWFKKAWLVEIDESCIWKPGCLLILSMMGVLHILVISPFTTVIFLRESLLDARFWIVTICSLWYSSEKVTF